MTTITKKQIIGIIADKTGMTGVESANVIQTFKDQIIDELARGNRIEFREFGIFELKKRKARIGRNPRTGATVEVPPKVVVSFKPGKVMKERVNAAIANALAGGNNQSAARAPFTPPPARPADPYGRPPV